MTHIVFDIFSLETCAFSVSKDCVNKYLMIWRSLCCDVIPTLSKIFIPAINSENSCDKWFTFVDFVQSLKMQFFFTFDYIFLLHSLLQYFQLYIFENVQRIFWEKIDVKTELFLKNLFVFIDLIPKANQGITQLCTSFKTHSSLIKKNFWLVFVHGNFPRSEVTRLNLRRHACFDQRSISNHDFFRRCEGGVKMRLWMRDHPQIA